MPNCLIGHTGFVGSHLLKAYPFEATYNSKNIQEIRGKKFDTVYCAGVNAAKWLANQKPTDDLHSITALIDCLRDVTAREFILISTIDVFKDPIGANEKTPVVTEGLHPYGLHRRLVEQFISERFPLHLIVRLPGLYGEGLKKNVIFDLLNKKPITAMHADSTFQFYHLNRLYSDIEVARRHQLKLLHVATEPVSVREIVLTAFDENFENKTVQPPVSYDFHSLHSDLYGGKNPYFLSKENVLKDIKAFVEGQMGRF